MYVSQPPVLLELTQSPLGANVEGRESSCDYSGQSVLITRHDYRIDLDQGTLIQSDRLHI